MLCLIEDELLYYYILEFSGYKEKIQLSCVNKKNNEIIYIRYSVIMRLIWFNNLYRYVRTKDVISNFTFRSYELQSSFLRNYQKNLRTPCALKPPLVYGAPDKCVNRRRNFIHKFLKNSLIPGNSAIFYLN